MLAIFDNLGFSELMIVVVVAVLVFGKRLPEVAAQAGAQIGKFRRSLQDIKTDTGIDEDIRKIQREIQNAVPRDLSMGEMARIASAELEKRMKANDERKEPETNTGADTIAKSAAASTPTGTSAAQPSSPASDAAHASATPSEASRPNALASDAAHASATPSDASRPSALGIAASPETGSETVRKD